MRTRRNIWYIFGAVLMVALGACSSSHEPAATSPTTTGTQSTQGTQSTSAPATGSPIKVGYICQCTGSPLSASSAGIEEVYQAWEKSVNASGGIQGHPLDVIYENDNTTPGTSLSDAQILIGDHVAAIVDGTTLGSAWASNVQAAKIPVVGETVGDVEFITNPDFYPETETADANFYSVAAVAKLAGATNIGTFYCAEAAECAQTVPALKAAGSAVGVPDVYNASIATVAPNYTAQCLAAQQDHVTALFVADIAQTVLAVSADCARQGYHPLYVQLGQTYGANMASAPALKNNMWLASEVAPIFSQIPEVQTMNAALDKYYPSLRPNANIWTENAVGSWAAGLLLQDALKAGGLTPSTTASPAMITQGLNSLHGDTLQGMAPPLTFTAGKPHLVDCWQVEKLENGVPTVLNNGTYTCKPGS